MTTLDSDAVPFDIPEENEQKKTEKPEPEPEPKPKEKANEYKSKKKPFMSDSSDDSDSDDDFFKRAGNSGTNIVINKGRNIHIGNSYQYTQVNTQMSNINIRKNKSHASEPAPQFTESMKTNLPDELRDSVREIEPEDMYFVADNIAGDWKKLARYLPPKGKAFSEGRLKIIEDDNPRNQCEAIYQMLNTWKEKFPDNATIGNLAKTLTTIKKYEIAVQLKP